jgi:hypothetical protein
LQIIRDIIDVLGLELGDDEWLGFFERASVASATAMPAASPSMSSIALLCHVLISRDGDLMNRVDIWTPILFSNILIGNLDCDWFEYLIYRATLASPASVVTSSAVASATAMVTAAPSTVSSMSSAVPSSSSAYIAMLGPVQIDVDLSSSFFNGCGKGHQTG